MSYLLGSSDKRRVDAVVNRHLRAVREGPPKDWEVEFNDGSKRANTERVQMWRNGHRKAVNREIQTWTSERWPAEDDRQFFASVINQYVEDLWEFDGIASIDHFWAKNIASEKEEHIVKNIFRLGGYGVIAAPSKSGKSWLALELATAVVTGTPFINAEEFSVPERRNTAVFYPEGVTGVYGRLDHLWRARGFDRFDPYDEKLCEGPGEPATLEIITNRISFSDRRQLDAMGKMLERAKPELVIFDSAYLAMGGVDGSSQNQLGDVLANLHSTVELSCGASMWVTTHYRKGLNKADLNSISGAGWDNWPNDWILLERLTSANDRKLRMRMLAYGRDWKGAALDVVTEMEDGHWSTSVGVKVAEDKPTEDALGRIVRHMVDHIQSSGPSKVGEVKAAVVGKNTLKSEAWNFLKTSGKVRQDEHNLWVVAVGAESEPVAV